MLTVARLRKSRKHFHNFTGLTPEQFDALLSELQPVYTAQEQARKSWPQRKRAIGAGHPYSLALTERLLMVLMYMRLYVTETLLGYLFDLDGSTVGRERNHRMMPALLEVLPVPLRTELGLVGGGGEARRRIGTLEELLERFPDLKEVLVDATEQPIRRPKDKQRQKTHYSGKKKQHGLKTQVGTTDKLVVHASRAVPASVQDTVLLRFSGLLHQLPCGMRVRLDRGYEGVEAEFPEVPFEKPFKAQRNHPLTWLGKAYNREQNRIRVAVEHVLAGLEKFQILAGIYRGEPQRYDDCFGLVCGLHNYRVLGRLAW